MFECTRCQTRVPEDDRAIDFENKSRGVCLSCYNRLTGQQPAYKAWNCTLRADINQIPVLK